MDDFLTRIRDLDLSLFEHVPSQTTENEKKSLLALQWAMGERQPFVYLEIGSYLGGSLQPYLVDPRCQTIISIDPRPKSTADARGYAGKYRVTTEDMLNGLRRIAGARLDKLHTIEAGASTLSPLQLPARPDLCFVDGEHTDSVVLTDARFCLAALGERGLIVFHDANIVYAGIRAFIDELDRSGRKYRAFNLLDSVFFVELGDCCVSEREPIRSFIQENYRAYLWSLAQTDLYRAFYNRPAFKFWRAVRAKTWDRIAGRWQ